MILFSLETYAPVIKFERQTTGISSLAWVDNVSGDIVTSTNKVGALRLWNAANESAKDMLKVAPHGITQIIPIKAKPGLFLLQLKNG